MINELFYILPLCCIIEIWCYFTPTVHRSSESPQCQCPRATCGWWLPRWTATPRARNELTIKPAKQDFPVRPRDPGIIGVIQKNYSYLYAFENIATEFLGTS